VDGDDIRVAFSSVGWLPKAGVQAFFGALATKARRDGSDSQTGSSTVQHHRRQRAGTQGNLRTQPRAAMLLLHVQPRELHGFRPHTALCVIGLA